MKRIIIITIAMLSVAACNPKLYTPTIDVPKHYLHGAGFSSDTIGGRIDWWSVFRDSTLNELEKIAISNNRDLAVAASNVEAVRLNLAVVRAQYLPSIDFVASAEGNYTEATKIVQKYTIQPSLQWELSLFGALRNTKRAAKAEIVATEWNFKGVMLSLTAEVATSYFTLLQYKQDLTIAEESYKLREASAALIDSMYRYGMSDGVALAQARSLVYTAAADMAQYARAVEQTQLALNVLLGRNPAAINYADLDPRLLLERRAIDIPVGLPSELLYRRPDVMQAYFTMQQTAAEVGVARSARYPSIALTGAGGVVGTSVKALTSGKPWAWTAVGTITQPVFGFGKLKRQEQVAKEKYYQSVFSYEQAILAAFSDVESSLVGIKTYREQIDRYAEYVEANMAVAMMTQALYDSGMSNYLNVIDSQRALYSSQMEFVNIVATQYINYINLYKALGGGW